MRRLAHSITLGVLVLVSATAPAAACTRQGDVHICQAEGFGTILGQDTAQARDEALIDARRRALEQVAGVQVEADTLTRNQMLFDQLVRTQTRGLIQADRVVAEGATGDGRYRVLIEAWVKSAAVQDRLESLLSELSVVVIVPEDNIGQPQTSPIVENEIVQKLVDAGYRVLDRAQVERVAARDKTAALVRGDADTAREIGLKFLSNLLVVGEASARPSQSSPGMVSAHAQVAARIIEAETGRIIGNVAVRQVRGFARDAVAAGERALTAASTRTASDLLQALDGYAKRKERRIEVRVRRLPTVDDYRRTKAYLEKQRWVSDVTEAGYAPDEAVIALSYPEKTLYLASRLGREPKYHLLEFDRSRILVEYRP